jgi:hypothetical protein
MRFWQLEVPFAMPALVGHDDVDVGSWFFVVAAGDHRRRAFLAGGLVYRSRSSTATSWRSTGDRGMLVVDRYTAVVQPARRMDGSFIDQARPRSAALRVLGVLRRSRLAGAARIAFGAVEGPRDGSPSRSRPSRARGAADCSRSRSFSSRSRSRCGTSSRS